MNIKKFQEEERERFDEMLPSHGYGRLNSDGTKCLCVLCEWRPNIESFNAESHKRLLEMVREEVEKEMHHSLHCYGAYLLTGGKDDEPLVRRAKKQYITNDLLSNLNQ